MVYPISFPPWMEIKVAQLRAVFSQRFCQRMDELKFSRREALKQNHNKPSVVILGAGPAGLIRAIYTLLNGNPVVVIEKRSESDNRRENAVALMVDTVEILQYLGVYQYMLEKGLIFPFTGHRLNVRLKDLEEAMKAVISELKLDNEPLLIHYDSQIRKIVSNPDDKADLIIVTGAGIRTQLNAIDLLIVAEGAHSTTNEMDLDNRRISYLSSLPVISAFFKDDRPNISSASTFFQYFGKSLVNTASATYYYSILLFQGIFNGEHPLNKQRRIGGSVVLPTPGQNYLGCGLSEKESKKMMDICEKLKDAETALIIATEENLTLAELTSLQQKVIAAKKERDDYLEYWSGLSFCFANAISVFKFIHSRGKEPLQLASWLPFDHAAIAEIGANKSTKLSGLIHKTIYLLAGDTLATVDPTTGLGCNTAIDSLSAFHKFLAGLNQKHDVAELLNDYNYSSNFDIDEGFRASQRMRSLYRPDAAEPVINLL